MSEMIWVIVLCGGGTFLLRWLPFFRARRSAESGRGSAIVRVWLGGVGPAAVAAMLVISLIGSIGGQAGARRLLTVCVALACVAFVHRMARGGIALATLSGAFVYGALSQFFG